MRKRMIATWFMAALFTFILCSCGRSDSERQPYGVFLSFTEDLNQLEDYSTVVIDAQYYSADDISAFRDKGHLVYSYINVGSLEDFRDYSDEFKDLALGEYEHWDEEVWVDVSNQRWQNFVIHDLAASLLEKGIDGFFVDNCDVYYNYPSKENLDGLSTILKALVNTGKNVLINGGDVFLDRYCENGGHWSDVITGINQETVFSEILWDEHRFSAADAEDTQYFCDYLDRYARQGADIYLLEYTTDSAVKEKIETYCREKGYTWYISDSIELD